MNQYTRVYLSKLAEELSTPPINYAPSQKPITEPITVKSPNGPVTFEPHTKEKGFLEKAPGPSKGYPGYEEWIKRPKDLNEEPDYFKGEIQPGIYMARAYGDQLYPELAKAEAYNKEHGFPLGPTAKNIEKRRPVFWNHENDALGASYSNDNLLVGNSYQGGSVKMNINPFSKEIQDRAFHHLNNPDLNTDSHKFNENDSLNHEGIHTLYDNPDENGYDSHLLEYANFKNIFNKANNKQQRPIDSSNELPHDLMPGEQKDYLSQIQQNQFKQTGSRFDSKQWGDTLDKIFLAPDPKKSMQVNQYNFEQSISQFPPDTRRMFRQMRKTNVTNPKQFQVIKNWQSERMPGITQNSPMTIGSRNVS